MGLSKKNVSVGALSPPPGYVVVMRYDVAVAGRGVTWRGVTWRGGGVAWCGRRSRRRALPRLLLLRLENGRSLPRVLLLPPVCVCVRAQ